MSYDIKLENQYRKIKYKMNNFSILEYNRDLSVASDNAMTEYYKSQMKVTRKQLVIDLDSRHSARLESGALQWMIGDVKISTGIKRKGFLGNIARSKLTSESIVKPEYQGNGMIVLEPVHEYIILQDLAQWGNEGMCVENGMFLASDSRVEQSTVIEDVVTGSLSDEGLIHLKLFGTGVAALKSNVPYSELIEIDLYDDVLKLDGPLAVCWSAGLKFSVELSSTLLGSAINGERMVNVYRGTGRILIAPVTNTESFEKATHDDENED